MFQDWSGAVTKSGAFGLSAETSNDDGVYPDDDFGEEIQVWR